MRIEIAEFTVLMKLTGEPGRIELGHRGRRRRTGITARPIPDRPDLKAIGERLVASRTFENAFLGLGSKRATVELGP